MDACLGAILWYLIGYPLAYGKDSGKFIGTTWDVIDGCADYATWMFQWAFAATAATIVSGAVAERCKFGGYIIYTTVLTAFIYPVVAHWGWSSYGWLSPMYGSLPGNGFHDFAGSGIVHMCGGGAALMAAIAIGPRHGRFTADGVTDMPGHSTTLAALGTFILWFGWYGFNPVSTLDYGSMYTASRVAVTTTLSAAAGGSTTLILHVLHKNAPDVSPALNGILAGLVGITAGCSVVEPYAAIIIGIIAAPVYYYSSMLLKRLRIDDPLDASPVHFFCGMWGVFAVGLFATEDYLGGSSWGAFYGGGGEQLGNQVAGLVAIAAWTCGLSGIMFFSMKYAGILRVPIEDEVMGLDESHHGGAAYYHTDTVDAAASKSTAKVTPEPLPM
jgi:Amt family ammonium transporter